MKAYRNERGQEAVEFALAAPIVIALLVGFVYASLMLYSQVTLTNAARVGTNYLVRKPLAVDAEVEDLVIRSLGVLDPSRLTIVIAPPRDDRVPQVQVDVTLRYLTPLPALTIPNLAGGGPLVLMRPLVLQANSSLNVE